MESWCGSTFHKLHHDFNQSQQTLERGHHPTSRESRVGWQDVDIMHSTPRFLGGWSQSSRMPYSNMSVEGLDSESLCKLAWITWDEVSNLIYVVHCCKGLIFFLLQGFLKKKNQQFFLTRYFALWFCRFFNSKVIMIVACTCSIMWSCSSGMPQSTSPSPQAKASFIVYVFPFCFVSFGHCSKLFITFVLLCAVDSILVHHCWHFWKEESNPKITSEPSTCYWIGRF
jgi:hypothetical protein